MNSSSSDLPSLLGRCHCEIASILRRSDPSQQAAALAQLLHELLPQAVLTGCQLAGEEGNGLALYPDNDSAAREFQRLLQNELSQLDPLALQVQPLPRRIKPGIALRVLALNADTRPRGFLILGLPDRTDKESAARSEAVLAAAATTLSLRLSMAELQLEQEELARFALVGQAFAGLAHELNNALNTMMLQTSVVQLRVDEQSRQELTAIRHHGAQAAGLIRTLQHVVQGRREKSHTVDLNRVLTAILEDDEMLRRRVTARLSETPPRLQSTRSAVKQLVRLLLEGICAGSEATITATTGEQDGTASLNFSVSGIDGEESSPDAILWRHLDEIGRLAGQSLIRQLGGVLTAERNGDGVVSVRIVWTRAM